jgi:adenylate cyclase
MSNSYYQQVALRPLGNAETEELLTSLVGADPTTETLRGRIVERTAGNPFYAEEIVRELVESGTLHGSPGAYRVAGDEVHWSIPATVQSILAARIDRLSDNEKVAIQTASVIGRKFGERLIEQISDLDRDALRSAFQGLTAKELVYEAAMYPEMEYVFAHPLTQEVAYTSQLAEARRRAHTRVAAVLRDASNDELGPGAAEVAQHLDHAGESLDAARWYANAARWFSARDNRAARGHLERAWELSSETPEDPQAEELRLRLCSDLIVQQLRGGVSPDRVASLFEEGREIALRRDDKSALALLYGRFAGAGLLSGQPLPVMYDYVAEAQRWAEISGNRGVMAFVLFTQCGRYAFTGKTDEGLEVIDNAIRFTQGDHRLGYEETGFCPVIRYFSLRSLILASAGRLADARQATADALRVGSAVIDDDPEGNVWTNGIFTAISELSGDGEEEALTRALQAAQDAERYGTTMFIVMSLTNLAVGYTLTGRAAEAIEVLERAMAIANETGTGLLYMPICHRSLSDARYIVNDMDGARESAETAASICAAAGIHRIDAFVRIAHARALLRIAHARALLATGERRDRQLAREALEAGLRCTREFLYRGHQPLLHEQLARVAAAEGDAEARDRELAEALRLYRENGADGHVQRLTAETNPQD